MMSISRSWSVASFALLIACGGGDALEGTYVAEKAIGSRTMEMGRYEFSSDGKVTVDPRGAATTEMAYRVEGGEVKLEAPMGQTIVMTLNDDGTIDGGPVGTLRKVDD